MRSAVLLILLALSGCATAARSLSSMDPSLLNQPEMDLRSRQTPAQPSVLTGLGSLERTASGGAGCSVCAH